MRVARSAQQRSPKTVKLSGLWRLAFAVSWGLPAVWVALCPPVLEPWDATARTKATIKTAQKALHAYVGAHREPPPDLNALRAFAAASGAPIDVHDTFGSRLDYMKLDAAHYIIRSFGSDGVQNHLGTAQDSGSLNWGARANKNPIYKYTSSSAPELYPAVLLAGSEPPSREWLGRLYVDPAARTRRLLVRHRERAGLFMVAPHDAVEEFIWLPDGNRIAFTATGSTRHRDGLYVWNLNDDTLVNLIDAAASSMPISPAAGGGRLWLTLAGVSATGPTVHAYAAPRHDGPLDPREFFQRANLVSFLLPGKKGELSARIVPYPPLVGPIEADTPPFARPPRLRARLDGISGLAVQRKWLKLATSGDLETVLLSWHSFSENEHRSVLFPYCLWILSGLYAESYGALAASGHKDAEVLRTFGTEIARVLINHEAAPSYLKNLALFTYEALMEGEQLPYHLADIELKIAKRP